jgi:RNA polymerase sigma-70 factor (ECF subfamily)
MEPSLVVDPAEPTTDQVYVAGAAGFEEFYRREYPSLIAVATALTGDGGHSEDLVQDTLLKALVHWRQIATLERPGGWCHRVLLNACRSRWRRGRTERDYLARQRPGESVVDEPGEDIVAFWAAVRRLPVRHRSVVALYYAADQSTAAIAAILDVPEGTVRSDLSRARIALANELGVDDANA